MRIFKFSFGRNRRRRRRVGILAGRHRMRHTSIFIACLIEPRAIDYIIILLLLVIEFAHTHRIVSYSRAI